MISNADKVRKIPKQIHDYLSKVGATNPPLDKWTSNKSITKLHYKITVQRREEEKMTTQYQEDDGVGGWEFYTCQTSSIHAKASDVIKLALISNHW